MKNAPVQNTNESAPDKRDYTPGTLPKHINTVTAAVMVALLESNTLTGMDSVFKENTTRLAAAIGYLKNRYNWSIERRNIATGTNDGRMPTITAYWLSQETIAKAFEAGAREWMNRVKFARAERRKLANKCKTTAAQINARKHFKSQNPRQNSLWGEL